MWWLPIVAQVAAAALPDSAEVLRTARLAQARFEDTRLERLPRSRGGERGGRCDETVGRFCFWHEEDDSWRPTAEAPGIQEARLQLIRTLERLHGLSPRDPWITGQLVHYLIESNQIGQALAVARACQGQAWWCQALTGYALHASREYGGADTVFAAALAAMPAEQQCQWTDLSLLLEGLRGRYRTLTCPQRAAMNQRIWWLADPLYLVPGNERRTEHYARRVITRLQDRAESPYVVRWGKDLEELVLRYGWPVAWERLPPNGGTARPQTIAHNEREAQDFLPPARFVEAPNTIRNEDWDLDPDRPVTGYAPPYATVFHSLPHQVSVFRRADSMVVVAGYDARGTRRDQGSARRIIDERRVGRSVRHVEAALVLARDEQTEVARASGTGTGPEGVLVAIAPADSVLVSLETLDTADSVHGARARYWLPVPPLTKDVTLSDPLLLTRAPEDSLRPSLADVLPLARSTGRVRRGERVWVFWETYGLEQSTGPVRVTLTVTQVGRSWLRQAAEWARLARRDPRYVSLSWEETPPPGVTVYPRALAISMPEASPGGYALELTVAAPGRPVVKALREIIIEP
jgi:hypothetical protein